MEAKVDTATSAPPAQRSQHHRGAQRTDADRADDRARQRRSRDKRAAAEAEKEFAELKRRDPIAARFQELWAEITAKPG